MRMFNKRITCRLLACLLFFNCLPALLFAQGTQAIITGTVVDNKGESVIGATIQVKNESTGFFTGSITNDKGEYTIKQLPLGSPYTVTASYIGYGEQKKTGYALNQGDMLRVEVYSDSVVPIGYPVPMIYGEINRLPTSLPINMVSLWEVRS